MGKKVCMFCGHRDIENKDEIRKKVTNAIIDLIENEGVNVFLCGGMGDFDEICANCVCELKGRYINIEQYLIIPYMTKKLRESKDRYFLYNDVIMPNLGNIPPRAAIVKRNQWMVDKSQYIISYIIRDFGGAYNTLKYGERKNKKIIEIG